MRTTLKYEQDCRNCDHTVRFVFTLNGGVDSTEPVRVRCQECRTTNHIEDCNPV